MVCKTLHCEIEIILNVYANRINEVYLEISSLDGSIQWWFPEGDDSERNIHYYSAPEVDPTDRDYIIVGIIICTVLYIRVHDEMSSQLDLGLR